MDHDNEETAQVSRKQLDETYFGGEGLSALVGHAASASADYHRGQALGVAVDMARGLNKPAAQIIEDAEAYLAFLSGSAKA